jgi:hypothetical protein
VTTLDKLLKDLNACPEAVARAWGKTLAVAWRTCPRADWMEWPAGKLGVRMTAPASAECERVRAAAYRKAIPYSVISKAAKERAK